MKKRILIISTCIALLGTLFAPNNALAQCPLSTFPANTNPVSVPCGGNFPGTMFLGSGTYAQISVVNGACYRFSTCNSTFDTQISGYNPSNTNVFYNNNNGPACTGTTASVDWTANFTGTLRIMVNRNNCNGYDGLGTSAQLDYHQIPPVITSSSSDMCPGQVRDGDATSCGTASTAGTWGGTMNPNSSTGIFTAPSTPGAYTLTYTLGACTVSQTINVIAPSVAPTNIIGNLAICPGGSTTLVVNGGTLGAGGQWVWYTGSCGGTQVGTGSSITVSPTSNTTYYVRAESTCGNTACVQATVTINTLSTAPTTITATNANICSGTSTTLTVSGGTLGTGSNYFWYNGSCGGVLVGSGTSITVNPLSTTTYYVRAEGPCNTTGCVSQTIIVTPSPNLSVTNVGTPSSCGASDGYVTVVATGGTAPYTYTWSNNQTGPQLTNAAAGGYCVTVTDQAGCTDVFCIALSDPGATPATLTSSDLDLIVCQGENVTFTGSGGYIYNFHSSINGVIQTGTNPVLQYTGMQNGESIWLESIDFNFCTYTTPVIGPFTVVPTPVITETITNPSSCGASDGSITTVVSGGTSFSYSWFGGGNGPDTLGLPAGPYVLTVTNQNGCTTTETYALSDPGAQQVTITTTDADSTICEGENIDFAASGSASYTWFVNGPQVATGPLYSTTTLTNPSVVIATAVDGNGCTSTSNSIPITVIPGPTVNIVASDTAVCLGDVVTFNGVGANSYQFYLNGSVVSTANTYVTSSLANGDMIYVIGTDLNGCPINSDTLTMTVTPPPYVTQVNLQHPQSCGANDGFITVAGAGGTPPYAGYLWSEGTPGPSIAGINSGLYIVTVTDAVGCTGDTAFALSDIGSTPTTMTDTDLNDSICDGEAVTFTASGGSTYAWYINGDTIPVSTVNPFTTTALNDGDYIAVIGYDTALCASTSQPVQFTVLPDINTGIVAYTDPTGCGANDGTATAIIVGGWPPYLVQDWTPPGPTGTTYATGLPAGIHTFTVSDLYGCSASASVTLSDVGGPTVAIASDAFGNIACENDTVTFTASPSTGLTYTFYAPGQGAPSGTTNPHVTDVLQSGLVSVLGTDQNNCTGAAQLYINVSPAPAAGWNAPLADVCNNTDSVLITGGAPAGGWYCVNYPNTPGPTCGFYLHPSSLPVGPVTVTYTTVDPISNCQGRAAQTINVNANPVVNLGNDTTACSYTLDAGAGNFTYFWSTTDQTQTLDVNQTGVYSVTVTDNATGCAGMDDIGVTVLPIDMPVVNYTGDTVGVCNDSTVQVCVLNPGDYTNISWDQQPNSTCFTLNPVAGSHYLEVTNVLGCSRVDSFVTVVYPDPAPQITIISGVTEFCKGGSVTLSIGGPWNSINWSSGGHTPEITVTETGNYCVTVLDANGCIDSVLSPNCVPVTVWNPDPFVYGQGDDLIIYNNPGTWDVQWWWEEVKGSGVWVPLAGEIFDTLTMPDGGCFYAVVTDENGCVSQSEVHCGSVGFADLSVKYDLNVYPNPTEGLFTLEADFGKLTDARIELRNVLSQLVIPVEDINSSTVRKTYNLNHLPAGIYIISIETAEGKAIKRITKR